MTTTTVTIGHLYYVGKLRRVAWILEGVDGEGIADLRAPGSSARKSAHVTSLVEVSR